MNSKINRNRAVLCLAVFFLTLSNSVFFIDIGVSKMLEYTGFLIILIGIYSGLLTNMRKEYNIKFFLIIMVLFSVGLVIQNLSISKKISLILSMFILASVSIFPCKFIRTGRDIHAIGLTTLFGIFISTIIGILGGNSLQTEAVSGWLYGSGFNGGLEHKNYLSFNAIAIFVTIYFYYKYERNKKIDIALVIISIFLLITTNSHGAYIVFAFTLFLLNGKRFLTVKINQRLIFYTVIIILASLFGYVIIKYLGNNVETYSYRVRGMINYVNKYASDPFHVVFGDASMAFYSGDYSANVRRFLGYDGTTELAILNILIKNGTLGLLGYILIFRRYFINRPRNISYSFFYVVILLQFIMSALVETYIANINMVYTIIMYLFLSNITMLHKK